jgi:hypothetical protein
MDLLSTRVWGVKVHQKTPYKAALGSILESYAPPEWYVQHPPASTCPARFRVCLVLR